MTNETIQRLRNQAKMKDFQKRLQEKVEIGTLVLVSSYELKSILEGTHHLTYHFEVINEQSNSTPTRVINNTRIPAGIICLSSHCMLPEPPQISASGISEWRWKSWWQIWGSACGMKTHGRCRGLWYTDAAPSNSETARRFWRCEWSKRRSWVDW